MLRLTLLAFVCFLVPVAGLAYQVKPMISHIKLGKGSPSVTYRVSNPENVAVPVEVEVYKRSFDQQQNEILTLAEDDFLVLPPQAEIPAQSHQVFRAQLISLPTEQQTQSYRIVFKQLAIDDQSQSSKINMLYNFSTLVFVSPTGVSAMLESEVSCDDGCSLILHNTGHGILPLKSSRLVIDEQEFDWPAIKHLVNMTYLMPGHKFVMPLTSLIGKQIQPKRVSFIPKNER